MTTPVTITLTREFAQPPERVFDAWLDPAQAGRFLFATPGGTMLICEIDARVGGSGLIVERRPDGDARHRMKIEVIDRPRRMEFLFAADPAPEGEWTRVAIAIVPTRSGCRLTLTHELDAQWADYADRTRDGWSMILASLGRTMENPA